MKVRRIDFSPDEWMGGTVGLHNAERGLYITACALIYSQGGPVPVDDLQAACRDHGHAFKHQLNRLLELGKLELNEGQISNKRCSNELQKAGERTENARQNVSKRWAKVKNNNEIADTPVLPPRNANHQPSTINHQEESPDGDSVPPKVIPFVEKGSGNGRRKQRQGFPADWLPSERGVEFAHGQGRDDAWIGREGPACRDFHIGKGSVFADHDAAWRTWVHNAARFEPIGSIANQRSGSGGPGHSRIAAALSRVHLKTDVSGIH